MTKNARTLVTVAMVTALIVIVLVARDMFLRGPRTVNCGGVSHPAIDMRDFENQYWAYSAKLEVTVADQAKVSADFDPNELAQVSQNLQEARDFGRYVVAGYNSCAITPSQYARFGARFHALDSLAQEINGLLSNPSLRPEQKSKLTVLVRRYGDLAQQLGSQ